MTITRMNMAFIVMATNALTDELLEGFPDDALDVLSRFSVLVVGAWCNSV